MHLRSFLVEDFKEQNEFGYIPAHLDTNVLNSLCVEPTSRAEVAKSVVLSVKKRDPLYFLTDFHIKWAMECIGYSFSLPIEHSLTISNAILIYKAWLTDPINRPNLISKQESYYQREMIGHMSLIFLDRPWDPIHAELCIQVIKIFRSLTQKKKILPENSHFLMKLCILCFSPILCKSTELAKKISGDMSRAIFEIWLRCETREESLWKEVCKDFSRWTIHTDVINSWRNVAIGLSLKIVNFLYGENSDELLVIFPEEGVLSFQISLSHAILTWNYLVIVILDSTGSSLFDPATQKDIVKSVTNIIDVFIDVAHKRTGPKRPITPSIVSDTSEKIVHLSLNFQKLHLNYSEGKCTLPMPHVTSLMDLFGHWLLTQVSMKGNHAYGQAEAIGCLCKIYCKTAGPVPQQYLEKFYKAIFKSLKFATESNTQVAGSVLVNSVKLLTHDHYGVRLLLHKSCIFKILGLYLTSKEVNQAIKEPCYSILSSIITIAKPYKNLGILPLINEVLVLLAGIEQEPENIISVFWTICAYIAILDDVVLVDKLVKSLANKMLSMDNSCKDLYSECLSVLSVVPFLIQSPNLISENIVKDIVSKFIITISRKYSKSLSDSLYSSLISMLIHWIIKFPQILQDFLLKSQIFEALSNLKNFERMKDHVCYTELFLMNNIGNRSAGFIYPYANSFLISPCFLTENYPCPLKHYILKNNILFSFYDTDEGVLVVVRNQIGRYVWKLKTVYGEVQDYQREKLEFNVIRREKEIIKYEDYKTSQEIKMELAEAEMGMYEMVCKRYKASEEVLQQFKKPNKKEKIKSKAQDFSKESLYRVFLAEMGYFQQDLIGEISGLKNSETRQLVRELDNINDKEVFKIPIFYLEYPEADESELCGKQEIYPAEFQDFISQMGIFLTSANKSQDIFRSNFELLEKYGGIILTREYYYEIISLVPAVFTHSNYNIEELLQYSQIVIIWNQRMRDPWSLKQPIVLDNLKFKKKTVFLLTPLRNNIVKVNLFGSEVNCGPITNNMMIPKYHLGTFLCKSIASFYGSSSSRLASRQRRLDIFNYLLDIAKKSESTKNGKISAVITHTYASNI